MLTAERPGLRKSSGSERKKSIDQTINAQAAHRSAWRDRVRGRTRQ